MQPWNLLYVFAQFPPSPASDQELSSADCCWSSRKNTDSWTGRSSFPSQAFQGLWVHIRGTWKLKRLLQLELVHPRRTLKPRQVGYQLKVTQQANRKASIQTDSPSPCLSHAVSLGCSPYSVIPLSHLSVHFPCHCPLSMVLGPLPSATEGQWQPFLYSCYTKWQLYSHGSPIELK